MTETQNQTAVHYERDADGIVTLLLDDPTSSANTMNDLYKTGMNAAVERLLAEVDDVTGVVIASAKKTFFAGGNLKSMITATKDQRSEEHTSELQSLMRISYAVFCLKKNKKKHK